LLFCREAGFVDTVIDPVINAGIDRIDFTAKRFRIVIAGRRANVIKGAIEHTDNIRRLIADDGFLLCIPQHRHRDPAGVIRIRLQVKLVEIIESIQPIPAGIRESQ
jgi:hypothetical protein